MSDDDMRGGHEVSDIKAHVKPELLRWARERAGLSQYELGMKLGLLVPVIHVENGTCGLSLDQARRWAEACDTSFGYLFLPEPPDLPPPGPLMLREALEEVLDLALETLAEFETRWGGREGVINRHGARGTYDSVEMVREHVQTLKEQTP